MQTHERPFAVEPQSPGLRERVFDGPLEFGQLVRDALACAAREGWADMVWSDVSFEDWPLGEKAVEESLQAWSRSGRRLVVLSRNYDVVRRQHARFVRWRTQWDHLVECRVCKGVDASEFPSVLWSPHWAMHRVDGVRSRGIASVDPLRRMRLKEALDECKRHSSPGFPASILGL